MTDNKKGATPFESAPQANQTDSDSTARRVLADMLQFRPGQILMVEMAHDDDCGIDFATGRGCTCDPDIIVGEIQPGGAK